MEPPYLRIDHNTPCYECCELLYYYEDNDGGCISCGQLFDWEMALEAWNEEDYMDLSVDEDLDEVLNIWNENGQGDLFEDRDYEPLPCMVPIKRIHRGPTPKPRRVNPFLVEIPQDL